MASKTSSSRCDACSRDVGLWQAAFTAECAHTFHLRCVSGSAACPVCAAKWSDTPATAPAPAPATPFSFASPPTSSQPSPTGLFGNPPPATGSSFSFTFSTSTAPFGQLPQATVSPFSNSSGAQATASPFSNSSGARPTSPPSSQPTFGFGRSLFEPQASPATRNPYWLAPAPPAAQPTSCSVCSGAVGRGQATVTSECNHTFHLRCVSGSVCPVCSARWRDEVTVTPSSPRVPLFPWPARFTDPFAVPPLPSPSSQSPFVFAPPSRDLTARPVFNDDEPVEPPRAGQEAANNGELVLKMHCEHTAVARDAAQDNFAVLVHAKAPVAAAEASARAPLDLVTVLDVSGSMSGSKLTLLKQAMGFVIDKLGPSDRLSVVAFSSNARRIIRLTRMSDAGKASAKGAVESLAATGSTNIRDGLRVAADVLVGRRHRNAVASVILLSDGQDNHTMGHGGYETFGRGKSYNDLVPQSLTRGDGNRCSPVHTFGFGTDHDASAMHAIAEVTGGTFSFIQNEAVVQDSFAQCIGGLLSVAVQEARVAVECLHPGVRVRAVKSGRYESRVHADARAASVDVGELYAEEERCFLLFLDMPIADGDGDEEGGVTRLIKARCTYKDAATGRSVDVAGEEAVVLRPVVVSDMEPSVEVVRERFRVEAAEDIAAAERGEHTKAARILDRRQEASAAAGLAGDARCAALVAELRELSARVADKREYEQTGRPFLLAGMSSHAQQRASTVQLSGAAAPSFGTGYAGFGASSTGASTSSAFGSSSSLFSMSSFAGTGVGASSPNPFWNGTTYSCPFGTTAPAFGASSTPCFSFGYATPAMQSMVESSRKTREQQQQQPEPATATKDGGPFDFK